MICSHSYKVTHGVHFITHKLLYVKNSHNIIRWSIGVISDAIMEIILSYHGIVHYNSPS